MTWFEAYMLWSMDALWMASLWFAVFSGVTTAIMWAMRTTLDPEEETKTTMKATKFWSIVALGIFLVTLPAAVLLPKTEQLLKIIATKKGVDAIQSDTAAKYLGEIDKTVTNGLKVLNQEIEKKLDKKPEQK